MSSTVASVPEVPAAVFMPPTVHREALRRPALERLLGPTAATRLSLVTGPAGYGKTTLVRQWLSDVPNPWAWIMLDHTISGPDAFWPALARAVQRCVPDVALDVVDAIGGDRIEPTAVARILVDDLLRVMPARAPVIVVIDDAHILDPACWHDLEWMISHQPPTLHLVVVSRSDPPFSVARFRALGWITEVRQRDLALTLADTGEIVRRWNDGAACDDIADALHTRTEGWAAGIRLALLALDRGATAEQLLAEPAGPATVSELLIAEALDRLPPDVRRFLQQTCIAPALDPSLCDALTGRRDSRELLRQLAHDHVFISAVDGATDHYRYHPMLAAVLRLELRASGAGAEQEQHRRAARWHEEHERYAAAVEQALEAEDHDLALELIVAHLGELGASGHRQALGRWLLRIPDELVVTDPDRAVRHCEALLYIVRPEWLRALRRATILVGDDRPDLRARVELFSAFQHGGQGHLDRFVEQARAARAMRPDGVEEPFDEVVDAWHARLLQLHGQLDAAVALAWDGCRRPRTVVRDLPAMGLVASLLVAADDPTGPALVADVIATWRTQGEPDISGMADVLCAGSELALRRGDLEEAENLAAAATAVTAERPTHLLGVRAEIAQARVDATAGRHQLATSRLASLRSRMRRYGAAPAVIALIDGALADEPPTHCAAPGLVEQLTERERQILGYLASHLTFPEIGRHLYISRHTVKTHVSRIYRKLNVSGRSAAIQAATGLGLL